MEKELTIFVIRTPLLMCQKIWEKLKTCSKNKKVLREIDPEINFEKITMSDIEQQLKLQKKKPPQKHRE